MYAKVYLNKYNDSNSNAYVKIIIIGLYHQGMDHY